MSNMIRLDTLQMMVNEHYFEWGILWSWAEVLIKQGSWTPAHVLCNCNIRERHRLFTRYGTEQLGPNELKNTQ